MLSLLFIGLTFLALILIPCLFIAKPKRLSVPLSLRNISRFIRTSASHHYDEVIRNEKRGKRGKMPKHVAIILDGNRRWAAKRGLGPSEGQEAGTRSFAENARDCFAMGINTVTAFAFSTENWQRPQDEVDFLMDLFENRFKSEIHYFKRQT